MTTSLLYINAKPKAVSSDSVAWCRCRGRSPERSTKIPHARGV